MAPPVICVDCSPLLVRSAGVKTYLYNWVNAMRALHPASIRTFLVPGGTELRHDGGIRLHPRQLAALVALNALAPFVSNVFAPRSDIFHVSNLLRNIPKKPRLTATIHDVTAWTLAECHRPATIAADQMFAELVLKRADGLIAVSENTRQDAIRLLGISPAKIRVIHLGVPPAYSRVSGESVARITTAYSLRKPWFLSLGTIEPRKNIDTLIAAWQSLPAAFREAHELLVAGMPGWRSEATMQKLLQTNAGGQGIRHLGYVPEADLPALTAGATALVYPSLYEGFGIPVAQAMAAGCPVITSNISSLPEITGGAAILIDPRSPAELASAISRVADSPDLRLRMQADGIEQASRFTWDRAASEAFEFFSEIAG